MTEQLGVAKGKIIIDDKDLDGVAVKAKKVGGSVEKSLGRVDAAAKKTSVSLGNLGKVVGAVGGIFGIQMGMQLVKQLGEMVIASTDLATAYRRQQVAAVSLAGSQDNLNKLLSAYHTVTKNTIDDAKALADVTKLQATGFADSAAELTSFVNVAKGISIAMGVDTGYVTSQLQLAIANQSFLRLDQIGLGVEEVKKKIAELKQETKGLSSEMAFQQALLEIAEQKFGKLNASIEAQATGLERLRKAWKDARLAQGQNVEGPVNQVAGFIATRMERGSVQQQEREKTNEKLIKFFDSVVERIPTLESEKGKVGQEANKIANEAATTFYTTFTNWINGITGGPTAKTQEEFDKKYRQGFYNPTTSFDAMLMQRQNPAAQTGVTGSGIEGEKQIAIVVSHYKAIEQIERQAANARIAATEGFERQRTSIIRQYGLTLVRDAEDFALGTARAATEFNRSVADMKRDGARREADAREELERGIQELRKGHGERVQEITSRYHKDMEEAEASHKEKLLGAAARLDAAGVVAEQRRFAKEKKQKQTNFKDNIKKEKESLDKQEKQREDALERQLETARRNDERRLDDMKRDFEYRKQIEQEDREIRLGRMAEDHNSQLEELQRVHEERMKQIDTQEAEQKINEEDKFQSQLNQAGLAHEKWLEEQDRWEKKALESFEDWWKDLDDTIANRGSVESPGTGATGDAGSPVMREFADGGPVNRTGPAIVHAGEFVLNAGTVGALRGMLGNFNNAGVVQAAGGRNITVAENAIQINASEGMNIEALGQIVRDEMLAALQIAS